MNKEIKELARKKIGEYLKSVREDQGLIRQNLVDKGLRWEEVKAIEEGETNYTIDKFLTYISIVDCYFYLAPREGKHLDKDDLIEKMR